VQTGLDQYVGSDQGAHPVPPIADSHGEPKHYWLKGRLAELSARMPAGTRLPGERGLAAEYATSRTTVRRAVADLVIEGRLERVHGKGCFVARPKVAQPVALGSYTDDMRAIGIAPAARLIRLCTERADGEVAARLDIRKGSPAVALERLRLADGEPMAVERAVLPAARLPGLATALRKEMRGRGSLYALLATSYGIRPGRARIGIETALATPREAGLLGVEVGLPMLVLSQLSVDDRGRPIEWVRSVYRGDRYTFVAEVDRGDA
jgi:GntR family transcriptional regulator